jgi:hypothetical protein
MRSQCNPWSSELIVNGNLGYVVKGRTGFINWKYHRPYQTTNWKGYSKATKFLKVCHSLTAEVELLVTGE